MNGRGCVLTRLYLQKQIVGCVWSTDCSLPTSASLNQPWWFSSPGRSKKDTRHHGNSAQRKIKGLCYEVSGKIDHTLKNQGMKEIYPAPLSPSLVFFVWWYDSWSYCSHFATTRGTVYTLRWHMRKTTKPRALDTSLPTLIWPYLWIFYVRE